MLAGSAALDGRRRQAAALASCNSTYHAILYGFITILYFYWNQIIEIFIFIVYHDVQC